MYYYVSQWIFNVHCSLNSYHFPESFMQPTWLTCSTRNDCVCKSKSSFKHLCRVKIITATQQRQQQQKMLNNWERKSEILGYRKCEKPQSRTYDKWNENDVNGVVKSSHTLNDLMRKIYGSVNIWQIAMRTTVSVYLNTHRESSEKTFKFNAKWILKMT